MTEEQYKQLTDIPKSKTETEQAELIKCIRQYCIRNYDYIRLRDPEIEAENVMDILSHIISMIDDNTQG